MHRSTNPRLLIAALVIVLGALVASSTAESGPRIRQPDRSDRTVDGVALRARPTTTSLVGKEIPEADTGQNLIGVGFVHGFAYDAATGLPLADAKVLFFGLWQASCTGKSRPDP